MSFIIDPLQVLHSTAHTPKEKEKEKGKHGGPQRLVKLCQDKTKLRKEKKKLPEFKKGAPPMNAGWDRQNCSPNPGGFY